MQNAMQDRIQSDKAVYLYKNTKRWRWFHLLWNRLCQRNSQLLDLDEALCCTQVQNSHYGGLHAVNIDCIRGSQGKSDAFDSEFRPVKENTRDRWLSVARAMLRGRELPPVNLVDVDGICYVRDGHHRISVARTLGQTYIDAEITIMRMNRRVI